MVISDSIFKALRPFVRSMYQLRGTGLPRVAETFRRFIAHYWCNYEVVIDDFMGHLFYCCQLGEHMGSQIFWRGAYSGGQLAVLKTLLKPEHVFIDLGANQGEFTLLASSLVGNAGCVFAFEPVPSLRNRLKSNMSLNGFANIVVEPYAIADSPGLLPLYSQTGTYSDGSVNDGLPSLFRSRERGQVVAEVEVLALDAWRLMRGITRVDVIKLDIEGAELLALRGGEQLIEDCRPVLILELNEAAAKSAGYALTDLVAWLYAKDYKLESIGDDGQRAVIHEQDLLGSFQNVLASPGER